jgi:predicted GNAT family acetyltransferase
MEDAEQHLGHRRDLRVQGVYTPPEFRCQGFASASSRDGIRSHPGRGGLCACSIPTSAIRGSNSVYRRLGYRGIAEVLRYDYDE